MRWPLALAARLRSLFRRDRLEQEMDAELRFHLDRETEFNIAHGLSAPEARRVARLAFGHVDSIKETSRDARPGAWLSQTTRELTYAARLLRRAPGFAFMAILIIALGIAATTAVFSVLYGVLLRPLPYYEPARLVGLWTRAQQINMSRVGVNGADARDWRASNDVFEDIALTRNIANFNLLGAGEPERLFAARISANLLPVLGVTPAIGRNFTEDEDEIGRDRVVMLSDGLWKRRFGADRSIVGRDINLSGVLHTVVGVMPASFRYPGREHQLWTPLTINPREMARQEPGYNLLAVARLKPGIALEQARTQMDTIAKGLEATYPATNRQVRVEVLPLMEEAVASVRPALSIIFAAALCLLLISCLNLSNLLAARAADRSREYGVRLALGASSTRLFVQALAEVVPILVVGGLFGITAAAWAIATFVAMARAGQPRVESIELDGAVLTFSVVTMLATGMVAGLWPAVSAWHTEIATTTTRAAGRSTTGSRAASRARNVLVVAQIALALPLLVGAGLLSRSFATLVHIDPGFQPQHVLSLQMAIPRSKYRDDQQVVAFCTMVLQRVTAIPGVSAAGMVNRLPLSGGVQTLVFEFDESPSPRIVDVDSRTVTPDYFRTMGIAVIDGRVFTDRDTHTAPTPLISGPNVEFPVTGVIDEQIARAVWPNHSAVGKRFRLPFPSAPWIDIIGVVGHIRHDGLDVDTRPQVYFNYLQRPQDRMALVVRGNEDLQALTGAIIRAIRDVDPDQPVYDVKTMEEVVSQSTTQRWLNMTLVSIFSIIALVLAGVGLYSVVAYGVTGRRREFGLRLALGAEHSDVIRAVLGRGTRLMLGGAAIGLAISVPSAIAMKALLFGVQPLDATSVLGATSALMAIALLASYLPARRAAAIDPATVLRCE